MRNAIDIICYPTNRPGVQAIQQLCKSLAAAALDAPDFSSWPRPAEFEAVGDHLHEVACLFDIWLRKWKQEVASNATTKINDQCFDGVFEDAVDGWATGECNRCAEVLREDIEAEFV